MIISAIPRKFIHSFVLMALLGCSAASQPETKCEVLAFATDPESAIAIHSGPGTKFPVSKTVPKDLGRSVFTVLASKGEWLRVTLARDSSLPAKTVFTGNGWVPARQLAVTELRRSYSVFELPDRSSPMIDISLYDTILPLEGCKDRWVKVRLPVTGTGTTTLAKSGWMPNGTWCGDPAYECDK